MIGYGIKWDNGTYRIDTIEGVENYYQYIGDLMIRYVNGYADIHSELYDRTTLFNNLPAAIEYTKTRTVNKQDLVFPEEDIMIKVGPVELYSRDVERMYKDKQYIVHYRSIYKIVPPTARCNRYRGKLIYKLPESVSSLPFEKRGRFRAQTLDSMSPLAQSKIIESGMAY